MQVGGTLANGDDVVVAKATKMEILRQSPVSGTLTSLLATIDDLVTEGQTIAIVAS